jgi:Lon protease-like protein
MSRLLPLFPLQLVAFPGCVIPLHIFEERYKEMVGEAAADGSEFGIVLSKDGGIVNAGCTVVVESIPERFPDGRFNVITRGQRRFSLLAIDEEKEYLRGQVEFFDDEDWSPIDAALREKALDSYRSIRRGMPEGNAEPDLDLNAARISFQLAQAVDDLDFQNMLLRSRSEAERLQQIIQVSEPYLERRNYKAKMQKVAGMNGSGHKPSGM